MNTQKLANLLAVIGKGKTGAELAREIGINPQSLRGYLKNDGTRPSVETLGAIADYMGISIDELVDRISDRPRMKSVRESGVQCCVATFEEAAPVIDQLSQSDLKRLISYAVEKIAV
jgi:transcriptional regulator with XRE-family HTH domain